MTKIFAARSHVVMSYAAATCALMLGLVQMGMLGSMIGLLFVASGIMWFARAYWLSNTPIVTFGRKKFRVRRGPLLESTTFSYRSVALDRHRHDRIVVIGNGERATLGRAAFGRDAFETLSDELAARVPS